LESSGFSAREIRKEHGAETMDAMGLTIVV